MDRSRLRQIFAGMERAMGPQAVKLYGVEPSSRFALTMLAADYRMKRIAMGHDRSPVRQVVSYLDLASRRRLSKRQPQHRWWFVAEYDAILHSPDKLSFELKGTGVKVSAGKIGPATAAKKSTRKNKPPAASPAARQFAELFSKHMPQLAARVPVFAELQNLIGLSVAAEIVASRYYGEVVVDKPREWSPTFLLEKKSCPIEKYPLPKTVPSLASYRLVRGRQWLISVSGGVEINPTRTAGEPFRKISRDRTFLSARAENGPGKTSAAWWWD